MVVFILIHQNPPFQRLKNHLKGERAIQMKHFEKTIQIKKQEIYTQSWSSKNPPKALLFIIHGVAEHSGRYKHVAEKFVDQDINVYSIDLPGHGKSSGRRSYIKSFEMCIAIIDYQIQKMKIEHLGVPVFVLGHSMGGSIAAYYALKQKPEINGFIITSAALKVGDDISPLLVKLSGLLSAIIPILPAIKLDDNGLSHDFEVIKDYREDPLNFNGALPVRTGSEINKSIQYNQENAKQFEFPVLLLHGKEDKLADYRGTEKFFNRISSDDKELKLYDKLYHELMNEYEKDEVINLIVSWVLERV